MLPRMSKKSVSGPSETVGSESKVGRGCGRKASK